MISTPSGWLVLVGGELSWGLSDPFAPSLHERLAVLGREFCERAFHNQLAGLVGNRSHFIWLQSVVGVRRFFRCRKLNGSAALDGRSIGGFLKMTCLSGIRFQQFWKKVTLLVCTMYVISNYAHKKHTSTFLPHIHTSRFGITYLTLPLLSTKGQSVRPRGQAEWPSLFLFLNENHMAEVSWFFVDINSDDSARKFKMNKTAALRDKPFS